MAVWAIADPHLSFGVPNKNMDVFGAQWIGYTDKIKKHWEELISGDDLILIAGDISWAMRPEEAKPDLEWIDQLPGTKVILRGNHDFWWSSLKQVESILPSSIHLIQNNAYYWNGIAIGGTRLWDTPEYRFKDYIEYKENARAQKLTVSDNNEGEAERIFIRELNRLELSLKGLKKEAEKRIVMTHYPPIGAQLEPSRASLLLEKYQVDICVFGHLHNVRPSSQIFGESRGVKYYLTSCDYLNFTPIRLL